MGNENFKNRTIKAEELVKKIKEFLDSNKIAYIETGYEFLVNRNDFTNRIKKINDSTSKFIRYLPDICIYEKRSVFLEAKNSTGIEKDCYDNYISLSQNLNIKIIICSKDLTICLIEKIKFKQLSEWDNRALMNVPIIDGIWKNPRALPENEYHKYLANYNYKTSGCTFAYIDFEHSEFEPIENIRYLITDNKTPEINNSEATESKTTYHYELPF